jgi:protein-arginine kinase activator protein McsA
MNDLMEQARALKDRLIDETRFDEAAKVRDLIKTIEGVGPAMDALERLVRFYDSEPRAAKS